MERNETREGGEEGRRGGVVQEVGSGSPFMCALVPVPWYLVRGLSSAVRVTDRRVPLDGATQLSSGSVPGYIASTKLGAKLADRRRSTGTGCSQPTGLAGAKDP